MPHENIELKIRKTQLLLICLIGHQLPQLTDSSALCQDKDMPHATKLYSATSGERRKRRDVGLAEAPINLCNERVRKETLQVMLKYLIGSILIYYNYILII